MKKLLKTETIFKTDTIIENINSEELNQKRQKYSYKEFTKNGDIAKEINYDHFGNISEKILRNFDDNSNLIEEIYYDEGEEIVERKTYERFDDGTLKFEYTHYLDGSRDTLSYIYNEEKKVISKILKDDEDYIESTEKFEYKNNKIISKEVFDEDSELIEKENYKYDSEGNVIEYSKKSNDEYDEYKLVNEYDKSAKRTKTLKYNSKEKLIQKTLFSFDEKDRVIKISEEDPQGITTTNLKYGKNDNIIFQEELNANNEKNSCIERKFDDNGLITESTASIDMHGMGINQDYFLKYEYEFFD